MEETPRRTFPDVINEWTDELLRLNRDATLEQVGLILQLGTLGQRLMYEANVIGQKSIDLRSHGVTKETGEYGESERQWM